ncbi:MAG: thiamine-phosphate kinase, partial [Solirubrobacterales bacterium]
SRLPGDVSQIGEQAIREVDHRARPFPSGCDPLLEAGDRLQVPIDQSGDRGSLARERLDVCRSAGSRIPAKGKSDPRPAQAPGYSNQVPRLEEGVAFGREGASAMIDLSDGLLADLVHIASESGVGVELDPDSVPVDPDLREVGDLAGAVDPLVNALIGGDDYELVLTFPPDRLDRMEEVAGKLGTDLTVIGSVVEGEGVELPAGFADPRSGPLGEHGFEHSF